MAPSVRDLALFASTLACELAELDPVDVEPWLEERLGRWLNATEDKAASLFVVRARLEHEASEWRRQADVLYAAADAADRGVETVTALGLALCKAQEGLTGESKIRTPFGTLYLTKGQHLRRPKSTAEWGPVVRELVLTEPDIERAERIARGEEPWTGDGPCPFVLEPRVHATFRKRTMK